MYGPPHGEYIQVWSPEQLPVARKIQEKDYIQKDAEFYVTSGFVNYESHNYLPVDTMSQMKDYIKKEAESYTTPTFTYDYQTPVKVEEPVEYFQTQSEDQKHEKNSVFDINTSTTDDLVAKIKQDAAAAEKAKAEVKKRKNEVEDDRKRARRLKRNEAKRRRRRNMSEEKRQLEREKNTIRSKKWRDRKKLEKQMMGNGGGVMDSLKLEEQSGSDYGEQEVVQVQSPAQILYDDDTFPSSVDSIIPTRESSQDTFPSSIQKKPRVTKLLTPEELEQRREVYRRLSPEQKREHNRKVMERRKKRIEEMNEVERREHVLKEYAKYVERYRKRKEKMKNDTPEERKERLKGWRESKRRDRERKKLQQMKSEEEVGQSCSNMVKQEEEQVELEDISLRYGSYLVESYSRSYEETGCQLGATNTFGYDAMDQESSELKYL